MFVSAATAEYLPPAAFLRQQLELFEKYRSLPFTPHTAMAIKRAPRSRAVFAATKDQVSLSDQSPLPLSIRSHVLAQRSPSWQFH